DHPDAGLLQGRYRPRRGAFDGIGNGNYTGGLAINCHEDRGRALLTKTVGLSSQRAQIDAGFFHNAQVADDETPPFDRTRYALADRRIEILNVGDRKPALL